jgi:hypothetical protein
MSHLEAGFSGLAERHASSFRTTRCAAGGIIRRKWSTGGSGSCTAGTCTISRNNIPGGTTSTTFAVTGASKCGSTYTASENHDPESDSNGTTIKISE